VPESNMLAAVGVSHHRAAVGLLERVALSQAARDDLLAAVREAGCTEAVVLSTCCRTEIYAVGAGPDELLAVLAAHSEAGLAELTPVAYRLTGNRVAEHLMRVVSGLDSRLLGDAEILGQVRAARRSAEQSGLLGPALALLFSRATHTGRLVRRRTELGDAGRTMGRWAVDVGVAALKARPAHPVVIGSGMMAQAITERFAELELTPVSITRRADPGLSTLVAELGEADLAVFATSAARPLLTYDMLAAGRTRRARPLVVVDLSLPRNAEPAIARLPGVRLLDLDDLDEDPETRHRLRAVVETAGGIVHDQVGDWQLRHHRQCGLMVH
jgi:glutamyl-tRNA reductase